MTRRRSWLFVPANREDRVVKAFATDADRVILDLEDACPEAEKAAARSVVARAAAEHGGSRFFVRINDLGTRHALGDLTNVAVQGLAGIVLPKTEKPEDLHVADWVLGQVEGSRGLPQGSIEVLPLVETALGVSNLAAIARCGVSRVRQLTFGVGDLTVDLGVRWTRDEAELAHARAMLVIESRAARLAPPIDTVWPGIADEEGLDLSVDRARRLGFSGKLLIHPSQIGPTNAAMAPSEEEVAFARRVLAAAVVAEASGQGAFQIDGRLMDHVSVVRARSTLEAHGEQE